MSILYISERMNKKMNVTTVLGREINTNDKSITEVIREAVSDIEMNKAEANKLYVFIRNEFKNKDSSQS